MKTGIELIAEEREEHFSKHNRTIFGDVLCNPNCQLSFAAALLSCPTPERYSNEENDYACPEGWEGGKWEYMIRKPYRERLIIAGALIAAEIDRLQRKH